MGKIPDTSLHRTPGCGKAVYLLILSHFNSGSAGFAGTRSSQSNLAGTFGSVGGGVSRSVQPSQQQLIQVCYICQTACTTFVAALPVCIRRLPGQVLSYHIHMPAAVRLVLSDLCSPPSRKLRGLNVVPVLAQHLLSHATQISTGPATDHEVRLALRAVHHRGEQQRSHRVPYGKSVDRPMRV